MREKEQSYASKGGEAALRTPKVSAAEFAMFLKGIDFPANRNGVIQKARANGAPQEVLSFFEKLPEKEYTSAADVEHEFHQIKTGM